MKKGTRKKEELVKPKKNYSLLFLRKRREKNDANLEKGGSPTGGEGEKGDPNAVDSRRRGGSDI